MKHAAVQLQMLDMQLSLAAAFATTPVPLRNKNSLLNAA